MGRSRAFSLPWSASTRLLAYWSVRCHAAGSKRLQHARVDRRPIGDHFGGHDFGRADGLLEEPAGCAHVPTWGDEHVDHLAELVDRAVDIAPLAGDLDVGLVDLPAVADGVAAGPGGVGQ
jgi:hypothetical protein